MTQIHKYNSEAEANQAIDQLNQSLGIPVSPDAITQTYAVVRQYEDYWFILSDDITISVLGEPIEVEMTSTINENEN